MWQNFQISGSLPRDMQKRLLFLLVLLAFGSLGALPIASHLLTTVTGPRPTPVVARPQRIYTDGQCTISDMQTGYKPAVSSIVVPKPLPAAWAQGKRNDQEHYLTALSCAAAFVEIYETFDYRQPQSLYTALPLLSAAAQQRFYEGAGRAAANERTQANWLKHLEQQTTTQTASVSLPALQASVYSRNALYLTFDVPYQRTTQSGGKTTQQSGHATVLLKGVQPDSTPGGIGWQVLDWHENIAD